MKKRLLLLLCLLVTAGSAAWADIASGTCKNGTWVIDNSGKLTVNINGKMHDYKYSTSAPWHGYADRIKAIHISSGCKNVGRNGFNGLTYVESVTGGENVEGIGMYAFQDCGKDASVNIPSIYFPNCDYVGECAFAGCGVSAISLPKVETWRVAAITSSRDTYGVSDKNKGGGLLGDCNLVDLGSKTKMLRAGSLMGPNYVFCQNPTPPEWERLYDKDEGSYALSYITEGLLDLVGGVGAWFGIGNETGTWLRERDYEYPFGDNSDVTFIVPEQYLQTYKDFYPKNHPEVAEGYMCAYYTDKDDHSKNGKTASTGKLCVGEPIYENGQLVGGWYFDNYSLYVVFSGSMPSYEGKEAPWTSYISSISYGGTHMTITTGDGKIPARAFKGGQALKGITYVDIEVGEITIGDNAFEGCTDLVFFRDMTRGDKCVAYVGSNAFKGCTKLKHFGPTIKSLGTSSFEGCTQLGGSTYPLKLDVSDVPERAFYGCGVLHNTGVDLSKVRTIGKQAFYGCTAIDEINLSNCTSVGEEAFAKNSNSSIVSLTFGPSTYACTFGSKCFANTRANNIYVSSYLNDDNIPSDIFNGVTLSDITLHCAPEMYGQYYENHAIFGKMKVDKVFTFPVDGSIVGGPAGSTWQLSSGGTLQVYCGKGALPDYDSNTAQPWYQYREYIRDVVLDGVSRIGKNNFSEIPNLKNVSIPRECTEIRDEAFKGCEMLRNIYITRVETLGNNVFEGCTSLKSIELGSKLKSVGDYVFKDCHSLNEIENITSTPATTTANSFASIKSEAYSLKGGPRKANDGGQSTVTLNVPDAYVTKYMIDENWSGFHISYADERGTWQKAGKYGDGMWILYDDGTMVISANKNYSNEDESTVGFWAKTGDQSDTPHMLTKKIEFTGNLTEVEGFFREFKNLESVSLCPSIKKIKDYAFTECPKLNNINFGNVETIGKFAFNSCTGFDVVDLTNVKEIGTSAFSNCSNLVIAKLGPVCKLGPSTFSSCSKLTAIDLSGADLEKASSCFAGCTSLKFVAVNATRLCSSLFANCKALKAVNLGSKLESVEYDAFDNCTALDTIYVDRPTPPALPMGQRIVQHGDVDYEFVDAWPFDGLPLGNIHLVVPPAFTAAYRAANIWKDMTIEGDADVEEPAFPMGGSLYGCGKDMDGQDVEGCTWSLDEDGNFVISGVGGIAAFDKDGKPWSETFNSLAALIRNITVTDQVTSIPHNFFGGENFAAISGNAETITLGEGLTKVGENALSFSGIKNVYIYSGELVSLWESVFNQDAAVTNDATLHVLSDASFHRYESYYKSNAATKRFPHIVADLTQADPKVEAVTFPIAELTMYVDQTINLYELNPEFTPANVKTRNLRFKNLLTSGNVYINDEGEMTALWEGKAYIEAWSSYTADGTELQALWGPDRASTYLKVTITEKPKPEQIFFDYIEGEGTDASWITCHVLKDEYIDVDTQIRTCEVAGYFNEDDVTTQAIPEWMTGTVDIPEEPEGFEVVRIGAYSFYERELTEVHIPWTATQIGYNAFARCYMLKDVYIPQFQPMTFTDGYGEVMEPDMGHNYAFDRVGEDVGGATLHVPAGCVPAWNVYPWNEWFRFITDDAPIPDGVASPKSSPEGKDFGWFDLSGRRFNSKPAAPGLYIMNGKKVMVK